MATNNLPNLSEMVKFEFDTQLLYNILTDLSLTISSQEKEISELKIKVERLENESGS